MSLSPEERETIILWSDADDTASVYTHDKAVIARLKELSKKYPQQFYPERKERPGAVSYIIPKNCVSIRAPFGAGHRKALSDIAKADGRKPPVPKKK